MLPTLKYDIVLRCMIMVSMFMFSGLSSGHAQSSVLSDGSWYRISVFDNGIYKIRYEDLKNNGILENPVPSSRVALFGGENGMLPELNRSDDLFDLIEIAILLKDGNDGEFGANDYILFYGQSPHHRAWNFSSKTYEHRTNIYTDAMSYFLTTNFLVGDRKRLKSKPVEANPTITITTFNAYYLHEKDFNNPFKSSQEWFGEKLESSAPNFYIEPNLTGLVASQKANMKVRFTANQAAKVVLSSNEQTETLTTQGSNWMSELNHEFSWSFANHSPRLLFTYTKLSNEPGWMYLDYLAIIYRRQLSLGNAPVQFCYTDSSTSEIAEFVVSSANSGSQFWDISNPLEPLLVQGTLQENSYTFTASLAENPEFIGFSENNITLVSQFEKIANQNLYGHDSIQYVIIVHPDFMSEAKRLAEFHRQRNLNVLVTTPDAVFNEFSYGRQDPMAIRRLLRHYRNKALAEGSDILPEYLLLFGSPSYDYRNHTNGLSKNFVLNYQCPSGLTESRSLSTDDMFGFLADGETGFQSSDRLHINIGRFPARTPEQAKILVDKAISYTTPKFGDWRTVVTNLADDGVGPFVETYEKFFEPDFNTNFPEINVEKIYCDAYPQVATPSGARYPEAKEALQQRLERGTLILNYEGHSGEFSLADEDIMNKSDILKFENIDRLPVFVMASCSFARYDNDSELSSGGEELVLSPIGGAIAVIAASRVAYTSPNDAFHSAFNHFALQRHNGHARTLGESLKLAKNNTGNNNEWALKPFVLLGDPALPLALPKHNIVTTHINDRPVQDGLDTIKALENVSIAGYIADFSNQILSDFNGEITITLYDKPTQEQTLGNKSSTSSDNNPIIAYDVQKNILFKGKTLVANGRFRIEFTTPKDINYHFDFGKISYYAFSDSVDAAGFFDNIIIGGFGENFDSIADAPSIERLSFNDTNFQNGNITTATPVLYAQISDKYGINYSGTGIGHNITLIVDDNSKKPIYLNNYFEYLSGVHTKGEVRYPMFGLDLLPGKHNVKLKVWNIFNISTVASLDFEVVETETPYIATVYNYPNPCSNYTKFYFTHNAPKKINRVEIDIFDLRGRWITRLSKHVNTEGFAIDPIEWNVRDAHGNELQQGLYLYKLKIICEDGYISEKTEKLIIGG